MTLPLHAQTLLLRIEEYRIAVHAVSTTKLEAVPIAFGKLQDAEYALNRAVRLFKENHGS
jgi:hypothetical protein